MSIVEVCAANCQPDPRFLITNVYYAYLLITMLNVKHSATCLFNIPPII